MSLGIIVFGVDESGLSQTAREIMSNQMKDDECIGRWLSLGAYALVNVTNRNVQLVLRPRNDVLIVFGLLTSEI